MSKSLQFTKGEIRKGEIEVSCKEDNNFIISTATLQLVKKKWKEVEVINLPLVYDPEGKKIYYTLDTSQLDGVYEMIFKYIVNEEALIDKIEVYIHE